MKSPLINVYCLNAARSNQICHTALNIASTHERDFDIVLLQEPWYGSITSANDIRGAVSMQGWQPIMPSSSIPEDRRPRVMAYVRAEARLEVVSRSDIINDLDIQVLDVKRQGVNQPTTRLVNIYNQSAAEEEEGFSVDRLQEAVFDGTVATILTGDWNLRHPICRVMDGNGDQRANDTVSWLYENDFSLRNPHNTTTWQSKSAEFLSPLDLTFTNVKADQVHALTDWSVEKDLNADSDHYAILFSIENTGNEILNLSEAKYNWKHADKQTFTATLHSSLHGNDDEYDEVFGPLRNHGINAVSPIELDRATDYLQEAMQKAAKAAVPIRRPSPRAKPWWTPELSAAMNTVSLARSVIGDALTAHREVTEGMKNNVAHFRAVFRRLFKKTKLSYYNTLVEQATPQTIYSFAKWTRGARQLMSPSIDRGEGVEPAVSHEDKCNTLRIALFPAPPALPEARYPEMDARVDDIAWVKVTRREVRDSIFTAAPLNAPGISEMTGRAYQWAWEAAADELFLICALSIEIGHHPKPFHTSIAIALRKPNKDSYAKPRAYRLIQLLEVLGKAIERIVARRMAYLALSHKLLPADQFGGIPGRSAEDAALAAVHDIEAAHNVGLVTSALTFDITGFFDFVSHPLLLSTMREMHLPLPLIKWTASFLSDRLSSICLDGKRDTLRVTETGIPQGSCVSPVLAAIFTAPMAAFIQEAVTGNQVGTSLKREMKKNRCSKITTPLYVDDGRLAVASLKLSTNAKILALGFTAARRWLKSRGLSMDEIKRELQHYSWRTRHEATPSVVIQSVDPDVAPIIIKPSKHLKWLGITYDPKLTFNKHVELVVKKGNRALSLLKMLGNSLRGLHQLHFRTLYNTCVLPVMTFCSTVWYAGSKTHASAIQTVQNKAARIISGAFKTTPVAALATLCSLVPVHLYLEYLSDRAVNRWNKLDERNPVICRLPTARRNGEEASAAPPIDPPYKKTKNWAADGPNAYKIWVNAAKHAKCTRLWKMSQRLIAGTEKIRISIDPPWHRSEWDDDLKGRITTAIPPSSKGKSFKKEWAKRHKSEAILRGQDGSQLAVYSDGSMMFQHGIRKTGLGVVAYRLGESIFETSASLGEHVVVYDTEMEGMAVAAELTRDYVLALPDPRVIRHIAFFADNTGTLYRAFSAKPGKAQDCSRRFRKATLELLDANKDLHIVLGWAPGHLDIIGNERADVLAKRGGGEVAERPEYLSLSYTGSLRKRELSVCWQQEWISAPRKRRSAFYPADKFMPRLQPTALCNVLGRKSFSRIIQCMSGHAHLGSYYSRFVPSEEVGCPCGEDLQTREHVLHACTIHDVHRHLLGETDQDRNTPKLLGTSDGNLRLAAFIEASGAFSKT